MQPMSDNLFRARHIPGVLNTRADLISRFQVNQFKQISPGKDEFPTLVSAREPTSTRRGFLRFSHMVLPTPRVFRSEYITRKTVLYSLNIKRKSVLHILTT